MNDIKFYGKSKHTSDKSTAKWCERCKTVHYGPKFDEEQIIKSNAQKIADHVDAQIAKDILNDKL